MHSNNHKKECCKISADTSLLFMGNLFILKPVKKMHICCVQHNFILLCVGRKLEDQITLLEAIKTEERNYHKPKIRRKILKVPLKPSRELEKEIPKP